MARKKESEEVEQMTSITIGCVDCCRQSSKASLSASQHLTPNQSLNPMPFANDLDSYLLLLLSDGNLPTGSFVSSSGLESYFKHGFPYVGANPPPLTSNVKPPAQLETTITFMRDSLSSYAQLSLPFVTDAHLALEAFRDASSPVETEQTETILRRLQDLDKLFEAMTLNHVAKRASRAQGVALLTLHSKGFSRPPWLDSLFEGDTVRGDQPINDISYTNGQAKLDGLVDGFKLLIRKGDTQGHLPICWGILTGSLHLSLGVLFHGVSLGASI